MWVNFPAMMSNCADVSFQKPTLVAAERRDTDLGERTSRNTSRIFFPRSLKRTLTTVGRCMPCTSLHRSAFPQLQLTRFRRYDLLHSALFPKEPRFRVT